MRRLSLSAVLALTVGVLATTTALAAPASAASKSFRDVPRSAQFYGDITWLAANGITTGNPDGTFGPAQLISRQAMAAFLYRFKTGKQKASACSSRPFTDVPKNNPFCGDIAWLKANGISTGNPDHTFAPVGSVTREAMAAFMYRIVNDGATAPKCLSSKPFPDVPTGNPFCGDITWLVGQGVTDGYSDGGYHPTAAVIREAMAAFLHRLSAPAPTTSAAHYVRTINGNALRAAGVADATADRNAGGSHLHLLDIGAQSTYTPLSAASPGVVLTTTQKRLTYPDLVTLLDSYLAGYQSVGGVRATVAVGTNSDGCFTGCAPDSADYPATTKGSDWWSKVIAPLRAYAAGSATSLTVVGANDIEPGFGASESQAQRWEDYFTAGATKAGLSGLQLVFNGSADGCPYAFNKPGGTCNKKWTETQLASLAGGPHIQALPQIYNSDQPIQWANIARTAKLSGTAFSFLGSLTEDGVNAHTSQLPSRGWISLWNALTAAAVSPALPYSADLDVIT